MILKLKCKKEKSLFLAIVIIPFVSSNALISCKPHSDSQTADSTKISTPHVKENKDFSTNSYSAWSEASKKKFITDCVFVETKEGHFTTFQVERACNCMLEKASMKYSSLKEFENNVSGKQLESMFIGCLPHDGTQKFKSSNDTKGDTTNTKNFKPKKKF